MHGRDTAPSVSKCHPQHRNTRGIDSALPHGGKVSTGPRIKGTRARSKESIAAASSRAAMPRVNSGEHQSGKPDEHQPASQLPPEQQPTDRIRAGLGHGGNEQQNADDSNQRAHAGSPLMMRFRGSSPRT